MFRYRDMLMHRPPDVIHFYLFQIRVQDCENVDFVGLPEKKSGVVELLFAIGAVVQDLNVFKCQFH